jgi:hypothetical protein
LPQSSPAYDEFFYTPMTGTTVTGLSDAYASFWYFWLPRVLWDRLLYAEVVVGGSWRERCRSVALYADASSALEAITHSTYTFVAPWLHMAIFVFPGIYCARRRGPASEPQGGDRLAGPQIVQPLF